MKNITLVSLLALICSISANAQSLHGDMESWREYKVHSDSVYNPIGWFSYDSLTFAVGPIAYSGAVFTRQTFQTTDAHAGSFAAEIISRQQDTIAVAPGILINMKPNVDIATLLANPGNPYAAITYSGGTAVTQRVISVSSWIKYFPKGADQAEISIFATIPDRTGKDSITVGSADTILDVLTNYTEIKLHLTYMNDSVVPKRLEIQFLSSVLPPSGNPVDSSTMYIDDVTMSTTDVPNVSAHKDVVACYPNPSSGIVSLNSSINEKLYWQLFDLDGKQVMQKYFSGHCLLDLSYLSEGMYFYNISDENGIVVQRGKLSMVK